MTPARCPGATLAVAAALLAGVAWGAAPTPSPGPAARVGHALDNAWSTVQDQVADALLITRVRVALLERLKEDGMRVTIDVHGPDVELSGQVEKPENVALAERVAASVRGVRAVRSRVTVVGAGRVAEPPIAHALGKAERAVANALLEARVKAGLLEEMGRSAFGVEVEAQDGAVTLSGTVPDRARAEVAARVARATKGVRELRDLLQVKP